MRTLLIVILSVIASIAATGLYFKNQGGVSVPQETVYDRVIRTGVIRCGYGVWPPDVVHKDPRDNTMKGWGVEVIEKAAANAKLKVEWVEETGWGTFIEGLKAGRFDAFCSPIGNNAERGREVSFTEPLSYVAIHFYTRAGDTRFDDKTDLLNDPSVKLATLDGEFSHIIARNFFPKAQMVSLPASSDMPQLLMNITTGKADGVFLDDSTARGFAEKNPEQLHRATSKPFMVLAASYATLIKDHALMSVLNSSLNEMHNNGEMDMIIEKFDPKREIFLSTAPNYTYVTPEPLP